MSKNSKYYYLKPVNSSYLSNNRQPQIIKWNKSYYVEVDENIDFRQYVSLAIEKLKGEEFPKPKSTEYEKVKPILQELFTDYYYQALRNIGAIEFDDGEFYLIMNSKSWFQIEYYSKNEKNKRHLAIDFRDSIEDLWLMIINSPGHKGRPNARKNGAPIKKAKFMQYLNQTLKFLSDHDSYKVYLDSYLKNFYLLSNGDFIPEGFDVSAERSFKTIEEQLSNRKKIIKRRLIEEDDNSKLQRAKLRGELEGLEYAIETIKINK